MNISENIKKIHQEVTTWRHELHANPELCYEENWTAEYIAETVSYTHLTLPTKRSV